MAHAGLTFGMIVGNRAFFPGILAEEGHRVLRRRLRRPDPGPVLYRGEQVSGDSIAGRVAAAVVAIDGGAQIDARQVGVREIHFLLRRDHVVGGRDVGDGERRDLRGAVGCRAALASTAPACCTRRVGSATRPRLDATPFSGTGAGRAGKTTPLPSA